MCQKSFSDKLFLEHTSNPINPFQILDYFFSWEWLFLMWAIVCTVELDFYTLNIILSPKISEKREYNGKADILLHNKSYTNIV